MSAKSRTKGQTGEREVAKIISDLTGWTVGRRVRQYGGDDDLTGLPGWCCEVKRYANASRADILQWWTQAAMQAGNVGLKPLLCYRRDRDGWRCVWPLAVLLDVPLVGGWLDYSMTVESAPEAWAVVARERENVTEATNA